jgi:pimeloyl-ACP methyl ester carboxylesterase
MGSSTASGTARLKRASPERKASGTRAGSSAPAGRSTACAARARLGAAQQARGVQREPARVLGRMVAGRAEAADPPEERVAQQLGALHQAVAVPPEHVVRKEEGQHRVPPRAVVDEGDHRPGPLGPRSAAHPHAGEGPPQQPPPVARVRALEERMLAGLEEHARTLPATAGRRTPTPRATARPDHQRPDQQELAMRIKNVALKGALAGTAAAAGAAAFNRAVAQPVGSLPNLIGGEEGSYEWAGAPGGPYRVAYTRRGAGPAVLLVHSIHAAAWSYEWRHNVDALARDHTVYTSTCSASAAPTGRRRLLGAALRVAPPRLRRRRRRRAVRARRLVARRAFVVAAAARAPERFPAVVLVGPGGDHHLSWPPGPANDATHALIRSPLAGSALFNALVTEAEHALLPRADVRAGRYVTAELSTPTGAPRTSRARATRRRVRRHAPQPQRGRRARRLAQPVLIAWGDQAKEVPRAELAAYEELVPHARVEHFDPCGSLPHDERSAEWNAVVLDFLAEALRPRGGRRRRRWRWRAPRSARVARARAPPRQRPTRAA